MNSSISIEVKDYEQFSLGTISTSVGLIGLVLHYKFFPKWLSQSKQIGKLKDNIKRKGAKIAHYIEYYGQITKYITKLEFANQEYSASDIDSIQQDWNKIKSIMSEQNMTEFILGWAFGFTCLLLIGPSIIKNAIKIKFSENTLSS
jgi:hypothetical protein